MLQYDIVDVSEGIGINKISASKECDICHYWYFADVGYKFQPYLCNDYRGISVMAYELKNTATLNIKGVDYRCILQGISKNDAISKSNNSVFRK